MPNSVTPVLRTCRNRALATAFSAIVGFGVATTGAQAQDQAGKSHTGATVSTSVASSGHANTGAREWIMSKECRVGPDGVVTADSMDISETADGRRMVICKDSSRAPTQS